MNNKQTEEMINLQSSSISDESDIEGESFFTECFDQIAETDA